MKHIRPGVLLRALRRGGEPLAKKASSRVTAPNQDVAAVAQESRNTTRGKAIGSGAIDNAARRQFQKTQAASVQAHVQARGQRQQAKRDAR